MVKILDKNDKAQATSIFSRCVCNGAGWKELRTQDELALLQKVSNESRGSRHVPLQHWDGVQMFQDRLDKADIAVKNQVGMLSPNERKFIYLAEVSDLELPDLSFMLGFISFNDKSRSVQVVMGTKVFCCSNGMVKQADGSLKQKHLSHVVDGTAQIFDAGIAQFERYRDERMARIDREKQVEVNDRMLADVVLQMHKSRVFGSDPGFIGRVVDEFVAPVPRHEEFGSKSTLWGLENAMTEQYKTYSPIGGMQMAEEFNRIINPYLMA